MSFDAELERIRKIKRLKLQNRIDEEQLQEEQQLQFEQQKQILLRRILIPSARERLNRIRIVKPEFVEQLELQLIQTAQSGKIKIPITDQQLKVILARLQSAGHEFKFRRS